MNILNLPCIIGSAGNLNVGNCNQNLKNAVANIYVPAGTVIAASALATFVATIQTMLRNDNPLLRAQILKKIKGVEAANVEAATQTWGDGTTTDTRDEIPGRTYTLEGNCSNIRVGSLNGMHELYEVFHVFKDGVVAGAKAETATGALAVKGFALSRIFTSQYSEAMNDAQAMYTHTVVHFSGDEWRNRIVFKPGDGDPAKKLEGIMSVDLDWFPNSPQVAGTYSISAVTGCGSINMAVEYPTELLDDALWIVKNQLGNVVPVTGITVTGLKRFSVVLDTTHANYTAGTTFTVTWVAPSALDSADVSWYESGSTSFPKS